MFEVRELSKRSIDLWIVAASVKWMLLLQQHQTAQKHWAAMTETGSIVKGKSADMLIIDGDPLSSIYDIKVDNMDMIIKDGEKVIR